MGVGNFRRSLRREFHEIADSEDQRLPLVAYVRLHHAAVVQVVSLVRAIQAEVVIFGFGDDPESLLARLDSIKVSVFGNALFERLAPTLVLLPTRLREAIAALCDTAGPRDSVARLAARCCISEASLARRLKDVGIPRPQRLIVGARLTRSYPLLAASEVKPGVVARSLGLASVESLNRQLLSVVGMPVMQLRRELNFNDFLELCTRSIWPGSLTANKTNILVSG